MNSPVEPMYVPVVVARADDDKVRGRHGVLVDGGAVEVVLDGLDDLARRHLAKEGARVRCCGKEETFTDSVTNTWKLQIANIGSEFRQFVRFRLKIRQTHNKTPGSNYAKYTKNVQLNFAKGVPIYTASTRSGKPQ